MEDLVKQLQSQFKERAASPLMSAFIVSWILWNYRLLVILFSDTTILQTFNLIDTQHFGSLADIALRGFLFPALTTAVYIFVYPYPAKYVYEFVSRRQQELHELRQKLEEQTPLTLEESRTIRAERYKIEVEYQEQLIRKDEEIQRLKAELRPVEPKKDKPPSKKIQPEPKLLPDEQASLLRTISGAPEYLAVSKLLPIEAGENRLAAEYNVGELERKGLVSKSFKGAIGDYAYSLTHEGREYFVKHLSSASA